MRFTGSKQALLVMLTLGLSAIGVAQDRPVTSGAGPSLKYFGQLAAGPDGVVFAADSQDVSVYALELKNVLTGGKPGTGDVSEVDRKIAALLGTDAGSIEIIDALVYPPNQNTLIAVMRGGVSGVPALIRVDGDGKLTSIPLASVKYSKLALPNPPPKSTPLVLKDGMKLDLPNYPEDPKTNKFIRATGVRTITDMAFDGGRLYVTGLSNEEFASKMQSIPYPFRTVEKGTSVEIWHGAHGQFETRSPVNAFVPYTVKGERHIIASYTCTPLVKFPVSALKPGADVRGVTIGEFGNNNRPLDMIVYTKGGKDFLLMANNNRGVMKVPTSGFADTQAILKPVQVEDRVGVIPETIAALKGVEHLDKLNDTQAIILARTASAVDLQRIALP